jgi:NAD(P)-dependent dehydrogenase (short-subunit alcohol dehydrogenase family)
VKELVCMNATVVMACRSMDKASQAKKELEALTGCAPSKLIVLKLDLCGFDSVRKFIKDFRNLGLPLHCLVNNAGVMSTERMLTQDGFEVCFTANHLSHFLLTNLLLPDMEKTLTRETSGESGNYSNANTAFIPRVVTVTSALHNLTKQMNFEDVMSADGYELFKTYAQSKLANVLFTKELQRRLLERGSRVTCHAVHPGCVRTEVRRGGCRASRE